MRKHCSSLPESAHDDREHYIPIRKEELVQLLAKESSLPANQRDPFLQFCQLLQTTFHFEYHGRLEELKNTYAPLDPDDDTKQLAIPSPEDRDKRVDVLFDQFIALMERANYRQLSRDDLQRALTASSNWGINLDVDFDVFDRLEVFARGNVVRHQHCRRLRNLFRREEVDVPIYRRLVLIFRPQRHKRFDERVDPATVYLKLFKDIPQADLEMLLPGTKVKMSLFDRSRIFLPAVSGVAITLYKIITGAVVLAFAGVYGILAFFGLVGGTVGYGVKSFFGYLRAKDKYQLSLTQNLYYQNLDNNAGVLFRLLDDAEEQEFREALLAYFLLWRKAGPEGWSQSQLDQEAEVFLKQALGRDIDFEVDDALAKLHRLELVEALPGGTLRAVPILEALRRMDHAWDNIFPYNSMSDAA